VLDVLFPLVLTIINIFVGLCRPRSNTDDLILILVDPEQKRLFTEFCKSEYSVENIMCYHDLKEYEAKPSEEIAARIYDTYLKGEASVMEINIDLKTCRQVHRKIVEKDFSVDLFSIVMRNLMQNMADSYSRFRFSPGFVKYMSVKSKNIQMLEGGGTGKIVEQ
jgi:hypothetical protein